MKKTLALYPFNQKFPAVYDATVEFFSKNYNLEYFPPKKAYFYWLKDNRMIRNSYYFVMNILRKFLKSDIKNNSKRNFEKTLLFCFNQLPPPEFDFILDLETVLGLSGYDYSGLDRKYIAERLASEKCKAINCWNQAAYNDLIRIIDCSKFKKKITVIPFAGRNLKLEKKPKKDLVLLFVASINNPVSFRTKGGLIALETYAELAKRHKNIKFFVRANIDKDLIKEYEHVPGLIFLKKYLPEHKMTQLFSYSDIFLEPLPGMDLMTKSMEFGIPVIGFDYECAFETVFNNKTGFLIKSEKLFGNKDNLEEYNKKLNDNYGLLSEKKECLKYVPEFVEKIEILINDRDLLNKMIKAQHSLVEDGGKYSLKKRNKKLLKLINPHIN